MPCQFINPSLILWNPDIPKRVLDDCNTAPGSLNCTCPPVELKLWKTICPGIAAMSARLKLNSVKLIYLTAILEADLEVKI